MLPMSCFSHKEPWVLRILAKRTSDGFHKDGKIICLSRQESLLVLNLKTTTHLCNMPSWQHT